MSITPRVVGGRYEVGRLIGRGGMADVYLGHDTRLGRTVAIKMLRPDLARDPNFLTRFRREAQSAAGLNHPAIVAIYDSGEDDVDSPHGPNVPLAYIVMEHVDGTTLRDRLVRDGPLEPSEAIRITEGILDALSYSHRMGIVHRDIKPGNVMLTENGSVKVMDFGIARAVADSAATMTATQAVVGTAQYLSPEQAQGQTVDARTDLYSTGCVLYELLTGRTPFTGDSPVAIAYQHVGEQPQPPSIWNADGGGDLDAVTLHALAKEPDSRYPDATAFRRDLENVRQGRPISAAARGAAAGLGAAALTQTLPEASTPTEVQTVLEDTTRSTADLPAVGQPEEEAQAEGKRRGRRAALITVLAIIALAAIGWGAMTWFGNLKPAVVSTTVPGITGLTAQQAEAALTQRHLKGAATDAADQSEKGTVFKQEPAEGKTVDEGSTVNYVVSTGPDTVAVPDVKGLTQELATQALKDRGLSVSGTKDVDDPSQDKGKVVSTSPAAGQTVDTGSAVTLNLASGKVEVPDDLVGQQWTIVSTSLANDYHLVAVPVDVDSKDKTPGEVLSVEHAGEVVKVGSSIKVKVAQRPIPTVTATQTVTAPPSPEPTTPKPTSTDGGGEGND
ncbi:MAG: Stk1 family PASTA domain-containing Ser/Thr kinase [Intrasporangium sp.]|uniref:Stk1 family PASTA domain-containing Ser/Thr kinase n=1 Tax=Intrasporangium sp. TaxID=1925024 RepID=UPI002647E4BD|nr:Stk1 family PASTA domain-containing Ser/Thr kinase [Intrasporangium sp.]MDN5797279.1 Stk1 family PASTA domain-containing Ser/Thr kinase [Intrasporangium sp.]